jgi:hypothetical protein
MFRFRHFAAPAVLGAALLVGCAHDRHEDIPLSAAEIGEGKESVFYNAPYDGRVYVYDATANKMLYNGELRRGEMIKVDAKDNKILVDNKTAVDRDLVNDHRYKIFFDKDENASTASQVIVPPSNTTIVNPPPAAPAQTVTPSDPNAPRTTIQVQPGASDSRTTVQTAPDSKTTVTTPDAKVTTDPQTGRTTVQPR